MSALTNEAQRLLLCSMTDERDAQGRTSLMMACRAGDLAAVASLIEAGADVNAASSAGTTPLMYAKTSAVGSGDLRILEMLIGHGACVNARDKHGRTALDYLVERSEKVIQFLRHHGAD